MTMQRSCCCCPSPPPAHVSSAELSNSAEAAKKARGVSRGHTSRYNRGHPSRAGGVRQNELPMDVATRRLETDRQDESNGRVEGRDGYPTSLRLLVGGARASSHGCLFSLGWFAAVPPCSLGKLQCRAGLTTYRYSRV